MKTNKYDFKILKSKIYYDNRGVFLKDYIDEDVRHLTDFNELKENFYTFSKKNVLRGMHFQRIKQQAKIISCIKGEIFDVIIDLRKDSPYFGMYYSFILNENKNDILFIPGGFAHGYLVIKDSIVVYKCDEVFFKEYDDGIIWDDSDINIQWPINLKKSNLILSDRDMSLQTFQDFKIKENNI